MSGIEGCIAHTHLTSNHKCGRTVKVHEKIKWPLCSYHLRELEEGKVVIVMVGLALPPVAKEEAGK